MSDTLHDGSDEQYPDIEIYLKPLSLEALGAWLGEQFGQVVVFQPAGKLQHRTRLTRDGVEIAVLVVEKVADGFASLWFDSASTPWARDVDCARAAARALQVEARCSLGGWQPAMNRTASSVFWPTAAKTLSSGRTRAE